MENLRCVVENCESALKKGIAWVAFWKEGHSWCSKAFYLDVNTAIRPEDEQRLRKIKDIDPNAIILNGYLTEDMTLDELTTSIDYHYEHYMSGINTFITDFAAKT